MTASRPLLPGALALAGIALFAAPVRADAVPNLDIDQTCASAGQVSLGQNVTPDESRQGCLRSEREARKEAERRWGDYTSAAKTQCKAQFQAGGYPSYVELVTCLELASGTLPTQSQAGGQGGGGARSGGAGRLTQEPAASQRTNPIEVLEQK